MTCVLTHQFHWSVLAMSLTLIKLLYDKYQTCVLNVTILGRLLSIDLSDLCHVNTIITFTHFRSKCPPCLAMTLIKLLSNKNQA